MRSAAALLAAMLLARSQAIAQTSPESLDPGVIYDRARAVWRAQQHPRLLRYSIVVRYTTNDHPLTLTHEALWDRETEKILVKAISKEEDQNPHTPHGTNLGILAWSLNHEFFEPFGVPELSPLYSFGLAARLKAATAARQAPQTGEPKEIGSVTVISRDYKVSLAGTDPCDDRSPAFHLALVPWTKPDNFPLRDLWVHKEDFTTCKLRVARNFAESPVGQGPWEVRFTQSDAGLLITDEHPLAKLTFRGTEIKDASIAFENVVIAHPDVHTDLWRLGLSNTQGDVTREPEER